MRRDAIFCGIAGVMFWFACGVAGAADLAAPSRTSRDVPYDPVPPVGIATAFPRSPLEDGFVNGFQRFATAAEARAHCPDDAVVRVTTFSYAYSPAGVPGEGAFMCRADAAAEGDRPAREPRPAAGRFR